MPMQATGGCGRASTRSQPRIRRRWMVSTTLRPLYPRARPVAYLTWGWVCLGTGLDRIGKVTVNRDSISVLSSPYRFGVPTELSRPPSVYVYIVLVSNCRVIDNKLQKIWKETVVVKFMCHPGFTWRAPWYTARLWASGPRLSSGTFRDVTDWANLPVQAVRRNRVGTLTNT
jgi:hypothetical protein